MTRLRPGPDRRDLQRQRQCHRCGDGARLHKKRGRVSRGIAALLMLLCNAYPVSRPYRLQALATGTAAGSLPPVAGCRLAADRAPWATTAL